MCEQVGVEPPADPQGYAIATGLWVSERVRAAVPGAIEHVRWLHERGLTLHTASGALSWELEPYLRGMGVRDRFARLYGPDLLDTYKNGPHFYRALLSDSGARRERSVVVDDGEHVRGWAASVGLRTYPSLGALREARD